MFTGIIEEVGRVKRKTKSGTGLKLLIEAKKVHEDLKEGSSIAVNGACLTVTDLEANRFSVDVSEESQRTTTLSRLRVGESVNLERAMGTQSRFGGHILTGHVDATARISGKRKLSGSVVYEIERLPAFMPYLVEKGSVAVDGVSLTISAMKVDSFSVNIIPYTQQSTTLGFRKVGDRVNIELDMLGKYVVNFLKSKQEFKE
jgi:riboflavin synthase